MCWYCCLIVLENLKNLTVLRPPHEMGQIKHAFGTIIQATMFQFLICGINQNLGSVGTFQSACINRAIYRHIHIHIYTIVNIVTGINYLMIHRTTEHIVAY
jgi:hypothetical protein